MPIDYEWTQIMILRVLRFLRALMWLTGVCALCVFLELGVPLAFSELGAPLEPLSFEQEVREAVGAIGISVLETVVLGRILLVGPIVDTSLYSYSY